MKMSEALQHATDVVQRQASEGANVQDMETVLSKWPDVLGAVNLAMADNENRHHEWVLDAPLPPDQMAIAVLAHLVGRPWQSSGPAVRRVLKHVMQGFAHVNAIVPVAAWRVCESFLNLKTCDDVTEAARAAVHGVLKAYNKIGAFVAHETKRVRVHDAVVFVVIEVLHGLLVRPEAAACRCAVAIVVDLMQVFNPVSAREHVVVCVVDALVRHEKAFRGAKAYRRHLRTMMMHALQVALDPEKTDVFDNRLAVLACDAFVHHLSDKLLNAVARKLTIQTAKDILDVARDQLADDSDSSASDDEPEAQQAWQHKAGRAEQLCRLALPPDVLNAEPKNFEDEVQKALNIMLLDAQAAAFADQVAKQTPTQVAVRCALDPQLPLSDDFLAMCLVLDLPGLGDAYPDAEELCAGIPPKDRQAYVQATKFVRDKYKRMSTAPSNLLQARQRFVSMFFDGVHHDPDNCLTKFQMACMMYAHQRSGKAAHAHPVKLREGDKVEARCKGSTRRYPGKIFMDNRDGTYDVKFDDGDRDRNVPKRSIKKVGGAASSMLQRWLLLPFAMLGRTGQIPDKSRCAEFVRKAVDRLHASRPLPSRVVVLHLGLGEMKTVAKSLDKIAEKACCQVVHVEYNAGLVVHDWERVNDMVVHGSRMLMLNAESVRVPYDMHTARNAYIVTGWRLGLGGLRAIEVGSMFQHASKLPAVVFMMYAQDITGMDVVGNDLQLPNTLECFVARRDAGGESKLLEAVQSDVIQHYNRGHKRGATQDAAEDGEERAWVRPRL